MKEVSEGRLRNNFWVILCKFSWKHPLLSSLVLPQAGHTLSPSPPNWANCRSALAVGRCHPVLQISLPLLITWKNTFLCYIMEWTETELSVPSEVACSQNDIMSSLGLLSFHLLLDSLMVNYPTVCISLSALLLHFLCSSFFWFLSSFANLSVSLVWVS